MSLNLSPEAAGELYNAGGLPHGMAVQFLKAFSTNMRALHLG
jgi:hypothetical protein